MKNWYQNEKGSMAVYAVVMLLSFLIILSGLFLATSSVRKNQLKTLPKIKQAYEKILEEKQENIEKRRFVIYTRSERYGEIIRSDSDSSNTTIQIYTDKNCTNLLKEITYNGSYLWQDEIPPKGKYYVKIIEIPVGYNFPETETLEFEILNLQREVWNINLNQQAWLPDETNRPFPGLRVFINPELQQPDKLQLQILRSDGVSSTLELVNSEGMYTTPYDFSGNYTWEFEVLNLSEEYVLIPYKIKNFNGKEVNYCELIISPTETTKLRNFLVAWDYIGYTAKRPDKVDVKISYKDGTEQVIELSEKNNWRNSLEIIKEINQVSLSGNYENYTTDIKLEKVTYVITMKRNEEVPPDNPDPDNPPPPA